MTDRATETTADWCEDIGSGFICGTDYKEHSRRSLSERWCFRHRRREEFFHVVMAPDGLSYYGPHVEIRGPESDCHDLFPGWTREWEED